MSAFTLFLLCCLILNVVDRVVNAADYTVDGPNDMGSCPECGDEGCVSGGCNVAEGATDV